VQLPLFRRLLREAGAPEGEARGRFIKLGVIVMTTIFNDLGQFLGEKREIFLKNQWFTYVHTSFFCVN
jgi:hypothetical protein